MMPLTRFRTTRLVVVAATMELLLGLSIYAFPDQYAPAIYDQMRPYFSFVAAALVAGGVSVLLPGRYQYPQWIQVLLTVAPAAPLIGLAAYFTWQGAPIALLNYGIPALALLAVPLVSAEMSGETLQTRFDLATLTLGLIELAAAVILFVFPHTFQGEAFAAIADHLPGIGVLSAIGAAALLSGGGRRWRGTWGLLQRMAGAMLPVLFVLNFLKTGHYTGVLGWGTWALALVAGTRTLPVYLSREALSGLPLERGWDEVPAKLEQLLEMWLWLLPVALVAAGAVGGVGTISSPIVSAIAVLLFATYNALVFGRFRHVGTVTQRLRVHMIMLSFTMGGLLAFRGPLGLALLAVLATLPPLAARALSRADGYRLTVFSLVVVVLANVQAWAVGYKPLSLAATESVMEVIILFTAAALGLRASQEQRRFVKALAAAQAELAHQLQEKELVDRIANAVRSSLDLEQVLRTTVDELGTALEASRCFIQLHSEAGAPHFVHVYLAPNVPSLDGPFAAACFAMTETTATQSTVAIADVSTDSRALTCPTHIRQALDGLEVRGVLASPVATSAELLGVIGFHACGSPRTWTAREVALVESVAAQVAVAMVHARDHQALGVNLAQLVEAHAELQTAHEELQAAHEELQAQEEELVAQQEELNAQHHELMEQREHLQEALAQAHRAEDSLRDSEARFRTAFDHAPVGMALVSLDGRTTQVNYALCSMLGYTEKDLLQGGLKQFSNPPDNKDADYSRRLLSGELQSFQLEKRYTHRMGQAVWGLLSIALIRDGQGTPLYYIAQVQDISERKRFEGQLLHLANYDPLTDLFNRRRFHEELERQLAHCRRFKTTGAVLFLDLDQFKYVNDSLGHQAGDELLRSLAIVLRQQLRRDTDTVARLGGDEFAIILPRADEREARAVAEHILQAVRHHTQVVAGEAIHTTVSIGMALFPQHGTSVEELLAHADFAMYQAKEQGRNRVYTFVPGTDQHVTADAKLTWERRIREALAGDRLVLFCQPIRDLRSDQVLRCELLLRMRDEQGNLVGPADFLPVAERFGLIHAIDRWVVHKAIHLIADRNRRCGAITMEVNLSGRAFEDPGLLALIRQELASTGIDPAALVLEITETAAVADLDQARRFVTTLKELGCRFAVDDFGAGFSSFSYLKHLPVDYLKIDGSYITNLRHDPADRHLVKAMVEVARGLGKQTIAEFVEDEATVELLRELGVDYAQGFHIGRPGPMTRCAPEQGPR